jgi:NitT/TauT family transport system substrate-binding protein
MMQLAKVFRGKFEQRKGWGWHDEEAWGLFFKTIKEIGRVHADIKVADVIKSDYVASANDFDKAKAKADAESYKLADNYASIDAKAIRKALWGCARNATTGGRGGSVLLSVFSLDDPRRG